MGFFSLTSLLPFSSQEPAFPVGIWAGGLRQLSPQSLITGARLRLWQFSMGPTVLSEPSFPEAALSPVGSVQPAVATGPLQRELLCVPFLLSSLSFLQL